MKNCLQKTIFYSIIIIFAAQLSINLFIADFKISMAAVFFSVLLFLTEDFPLLPVTCVSAAGVFGTRLLLYWFKNGALNGACLTFMPEMSFYICYGLLLFLYTRLFHSWRKHKNIAFPVLVFIDYVSNISELLLRAPSHLLNIQAHVSILLVALFRAFTICCLLMIFDRYRVFLLKQEHEERYRRLLIFTSRLNEEVVWMRKNTVTIEAAMNTAYQLYNNLKKIEADPLLSSSALSISKDIHEIKKEYLLIMRGISESLDQELDNSGMYLEEIFLILKNSMLLTAKEQDKNLRFSFSFQNNPYTEQHYAFMSIFRNLFMNALEAGKKENICIKVTESQKDSDYIFTVTDDGPGILPENISEIFEAGFSTKINYETGEINRGLGLSLVKDLVKSQLGGHIFLTSVPGQTTFTIQIPVNRLKKNAEVQNEILSDR